MTTDPAYYLSIYIHAHKTGNSVPPHIEAEAIAALQARAPESATMNGFLATKEAVEEYLHDTNAQPESTERPIWTEGVCGDGAAILKDGVMQPIEDVIAALNAAEVAQLEPVGPTYEEILQWLRNDRTWGVVIAPTEWRHEDDALLDLIQRAIARWGRPAIAPIPLGERKPEEKDCTTGRGECWHWQQGAECWELIYPPENYYVFDEWTHWLPHWALPIPQKDSENK
jgi:hypothetical protein